MIPKIFIVIKNISSCVIGGGLHSIEQTPKYQQYQRESKSYSERQLREMIGHKITNDHKPYDNLAGIVAIFREVVYLLLIHHGDTLLAMAMPED